MMLGTLLGCIRAMPLGVRIVFEERAARVSIASAAVLGPSILTSWFNLGNLDRLPINMRILWCCVAGGLLVASCVLATLTVRGIVGCRPGVAFEAMSAVAFGALLALGALHDRRRLLGAHGPTE
jgi:hypothetical protein